MAKDYIEIRFPLQGINTDVLSGLIFAAGGLGVQELETREWIIYFPGSWTPEHCRNLLKRLQKLHPPLNTAAISIERMPFRDWNAQWRQYFRPFQVLDHCWIRPPWEALPAGVQGEVIVIDPQMAFGTGHHETTRLMMQAMQKVTLKDSEVLDLGSGSGILAFWARKSGAAQVTALDSDPDAVANARHNLELNDIDQVDILLGDQSLVLGKTFSVILANLHFQALHSLARDFYRLLQPRGILILSGILREDVSRLSARYKHTGFLAVDRLEMNEWAALLYEKPAL